MAQQDKLSQAFEAEGTSESTHESDDRVSPSGIVIKKLYTPADTENLDYEEELGFPGKPPYTRGVYPEMYRKQLWTQRQVCGYGTCEETNQRLRFLNEQGQTGLNIVPDTPTIYGLDSDDPLADGEVGIASPLKLNGIRTTGLN